MRVLPLVTATLLSLSPALLGAQGLSFGVAAGPGTVSDAMTHDPERSLHGQLSTTWQTAGDWGVRLDVLYSRWTAHENIVCERAGADRPARCFGQTDEHDQGMASVHALRRFGNERVTPYLFAGVGAVHDWTASVRFRQCIPGTLCDQPGSTRREYRSLDFTFSGGAGVELGSRVFVEMRTTGNPAAGSRHRLFPLLVGVKL